MRLRRLLALSTLASSLAVPTALVSGTMFAGTAHAADSDVFGFGNALVAGAPDNIVSPLISMAADPDGTGYWLVAGDGGVFSYDAPFFGSTGGMALNAPVVDMAPTPSGLGYWMVANDGGIFAFGDATFAGSMGGLPLNRPMVAIASTKSGKGYWTIASDGGVFAFGDATFYGSLPGSNVTAKAVDLLVRPQGDGYWIVTDGGKVYPFGAAADLGDLGTVNAVPNGRIVGGTVSATGLGYLLASTKGSIYAFGDATYQGGPVIQPGMRAVAIASKPAGDGYWVAVTSGLVPVSPGEISSGVLAMQRRLKELGFLMLEEGGHYGALTRQAVMAFQKYAGLPRDGVAGESTVRAMEDATPAQARTRTGDIVEVDKARQILMIVRNGRTVAVLNASTGSQRPYRETLPDGRIATGDAITYDGLYHVYYQLSYGWRISDLGQLWRPKYFNGGIAIHGALSVPAYPASHGCVRVSIDAMNWVWDTGIIPKGMAVWVYS